MFLFTLYISNRYFFYIYITVVVAVAVVVVNKYHQWCYYYEYVGGWVGRWCWVASSAGASYYFGIW